MSGAVGDDSRANSQIDCENAGEQTACLNAFRFAARNDRTLVHQRNGVRIPRREVEVVQDRQHSDAPLRGALRRVKEGELVRQVEVGDRFIEQERLALMNGSGGFNLRQDACKLNASLLAARESCVRSRGERKRVRDC